MLQDKQKIEHWLEPPSARILLADFLLAHTELLEVINSATGDAGLVISPWRGDVFKPKPGRIASNFYLQSRNGQLDGNWRCHDLELPVVGSSMSLEQSEDPARFLRELARVLRPNGLLVIVSLNPLSLKSWAEHRRGANLISSMRVTAALHANGLKLLNSGGIGPLWSAQRSVDVTNAENRFGFLNPMRRFNYHVARRNEIGLTMIRNNMPRTAIAPKAISG